MRAKGKRRSGGKVLESPTAGWKGVLAARLPLYGHRNWVVVADAAYPAQAREGIETIATGAGQLEVVSAVLAALDRVRHVKPTIYTDAELEFVADGDAPGVAAYRRVLKGFLAGRDVNGVLHEQLISKLDQAAATFRVLILKTTMVLPYTSVFMQLECGYWNAEAEGRLRRTLG